MERDHIKHIGLIDLRISVCFTFVQIYHNTVRSFTGNRIMHHLITVDIFIFSNGFNLAIRRICYTCRYINQFDADRILIASEHFPANFMIILIRDRYIDQGITFLCCHAGSITDLDQPICIAAAGLVADCNTNIDIIANIFFCKTFFINFQSYIVINFICGFQFNSILIFTGFTLHIGKPVRRIVDDIGCQSGFLPIKVV